MFSKALLNATYQNGRPGQPTKAHEQAEHHRFKKEFLFKEQIIAKDIYASRLIQQLLIIKTLEQHLQSEAAKTELSAFFALNYLEQLWRSQAMENDLKSLGLDPQAIKTEQTTPATKTYLSHLETLKPKALLAHFLLHVVGFMHGGNIIQTRYLKPSNERSPDKIPAEQYDFSAAIAKAEERSIMSLYGSMMQEVDKISLSDEEYDELFAECNLVYESMSAIYDDLCIMHTQQQSLNKASLALLSVSLAALAFIIKLAADYLNWDKQQSYRPA